MFREMRRKTQALSRGECLEIFAKNTDGVLSLLGDGGYPYGVPLNHVLLDEKLYFHCAPEGHKADAVCGYDKASYCVIDAREVDARELSTRYRSVIAFGRVRMVEDAETKRSVLMAIGKRFAPGNMTKAQEEIQSSIHHTGIIELTIEHLSGKESRALAKERREGE